MDNNRCMIHICNEIGDKEEFVYCNEKEIYYKVNIQNKAKLMSILGKYLPNPYQLESIKNTERKKYSPVTYKLWEHWNNIEGK